MSTRKTSYTNVRFLSCTSNSMSFLSLLKVLHIRKPPLQCSNYKPPGKQGRINWQNYRRFEVACFPYCQCRTFIATPTTLIIQKVPSAHPTPRRFLSTTHNLPSCKTSSSLILLRVLVGLKLQLFEETLLWIS